jgi:hypothetical protein
MTPLAWMFAGLWLLQVVVAVAVTFMVDRRRRETPWFETGFYSPRDTIPDYDDDVPTERVEVPSIRPRQGGAP